MSLTNEYNVIVNSELTALEIEASDLFEVFEPEEIRFCIAQEVTYARLVEAFYDSFVIFLREVYYKGREESLSDYFIESEAKSMANEEAWITVYCDDIVDDYDEISEEEKLRVIWGR